MDPNGILGSHDYPLHLWSLDNKTRMEEIMAHLQKHEEAIQYIVCHPKAFIASMGTDVLAKIFL